MAQERIFNFSTRRIGGIRFIKLGRFSLSFCVARSARPIKQGNRAMSKFRMESNAKKAARQQWNALLESAVVQLDPAFAGRIPWDAAAHLFNQGNSPGLAALKIVQGEQPRGLPFPSGATVKGVES